ncbi:SDR family oxidoreductase [Sinorhizobium meliloti]|uniref:Short-chain dehydrogenase/reductase SDR n=2 Tax=Sinorhizobium TaxID=28105 RepID=H0G2Y8_RHIML|nr:MULTISPECIES: SDR family oxidoreductase [Sinorhizobium]EHK76359.1 short-chain dehydrogenase/reductase SDR [Sinorhizobium meliloti CCNWSX0020]MDW9594947.1 SDR family oxidoreductase [Sinorhizobium meliloti]MDX0189926.1 SDR family oxidoreductase [Sinorhizobium meliloti]MQV09926.1 SDR family oxidoreductase [Sinorhizobium meliloti]MQV61086.1 SDR family oxidoreductase [Sinorhizobium meliloti]
MSALDGKVAIITGGNSGIGKATARLFVREGANVIITGRRPDVVDNAVREIGAGASGFCGDVADIAFHSRLAAEVRNRFGAIDIYMANAGIINLAGSHTVSPEEYDQHFAVNSRGVFFGVQAIAPLIRDGGNIIVTSSLAATKILPQHTVYAGSKAALAAFARNWAIEFKERRIRVNILSPGPVDTEILGKLGVSEADRPALEEHMANIIPAGRYGQPEELAQAALLLASNGFVNGVELHVDGGMSLA